VARRARSERWRADHRRASGPARQRLHALRSPAAASGSATQFLGRMALDR
jgi:hypothetical protein